MIPSENGLSEWEREREAERAKHRKKDNRKTAIFLIVVMIVFTAGVAGAIAQYHNYTAKQYPLIKAEQYLSLAQTTININTTVYDLQQAESYLQAYHGNPVWWFATPASNWAAIQTQLNGTIAYGHSLSDNMSNVNNVSYAIVYQKYIGAINNLNQAIQNNQGWVGMPPALVSTQIFAAAGGLVMLLAGLVIALEFEYDYPRLYKAGLWTFVCSIPLLITMVVLWALF